MVPGEVVNQLSSAQCSISPGCAGAQYGGWAAGSALAASLTEAMELGSGADRSWSNLPSFIWMCALFKFAPLALLPFVDARDGAEDATGASYREETEEENER